MAGGNLNMIKNDLEAKHFKLHVKDEMEDTSKAAIGESGRSVRRTLRMGSWKF